MAESHVQTHRHLSGMNMDVKRADPADATGTSTSTDDDQRVEVIQLSGPIKIFVPMNEHVEAERVARKQSESHKVKNSQPRSADKHVETTCDSASFSHQVTQTMVHKTPTTTPCSTMDPVLETTESHSRSTDCNIPDDTLSPFCPYLPGNEIFLKTSDNGKSIRARILKCFPATLSCCMVIRFIEPQTFNNTTECVLKLYDRRFSIQQREECENTSWSPELEKQYQGFVRCGDAEEFFSYWDAEKEAFDEWSVAYVRNRRRWSAAKWEAYLQWMSKSMYEVEKKAYEQMINLQGQDVPKVFGEVVLDQAVDDLVDKNIDEDNTRQTDCSASVSSIDPDENPLIVSIPGLLLQYIEGFHMTDLHEHLRHEHWQSIVESAIAVLHRIQDCGILNRDVNTRSFIVNSHTHKVMMIDYGLVGFREDCEDERIWEMVQASQDEEGAIGQVMRSILKDKGGNGFIYKPSERTWRLGYRFQMEGGEKEGGTKEEDEYVEKHKDFVFA